ncbi:protein ripply1 [Tenrec ecaudatus]|uniref:protein ripply1 n=1 Tax=Tenrec ecaudatus TaxID=94439 RepID=UPI003F591607
MDPTDPAAAAASALSLALPRALLAFPGQISPLPLFSGQEIKRVERTTLWRPWLPSPNDPPRQVRKLIDLAAGRATAAEVTKAESQFCHPVRLFWPKSRSFDYLYSDGELLLQSLPVQATINLYEDSDSEDEEDEEDEEEEKEKADGKDPEECRGERQAQIEVILSVSAFIIKALKEPPTDRKKQKNIKHSGDGTFNEIVSIAYQMRQRSLVRERSELLETLGTSQSVDCNVNGSHPHDIIDDINSGVVECSAS